MGGLLPKTGDLAIAYPPMAAGAALAIREINAAGGVLGEPVTWMDGDDGTSPAVAKATVATHVGGRGQRHHRRRRARASPGRCCRTWWRPGEILFSPVEHRRQPDRRRGQGPLLPHRPAGQPAGPGAGRRDPPRRARRRSSSSPVRTPTVRASRPPSVTSWRRPASPATGSSCSRTTRRPTPRRPRWTSAAARRRSRSSAPEAVLIIGFGESAEVIRALADSGVQIRH